MVNIDSGNQKFSSGKLRRIDENENLNMKIEGTDHTIKSYDEENGFTYSNEEAKNTCVAYVEHGNKSWYMQQPRLSGFENRRLARQFEEFNE